MHSYKRYAYKGIFLLLTTKRHIYEKVNVVVYEINILMFGLEFLIWDFTLVIFA